MATEVAAEESTVLQQEVEGEKFVTRHILEQTRRNGDDLAAIKSRLDRVEHPLGGVERKVDALNRNLPKIVGESCAKYSKRNGSAERKQLPVEARTS